MGSTPGNAWGRLTSRAKQAAESLKAEYEAGKRGDDSPSTPLWSSPLANLDGFLSLLGSTRARQVASDGVQAPTGPAMEPATDGTTPAEPATDAEVAEVSRLLGEVDWTAVRESASSRSADAAQAVKAMAAQVDWAAVQPVAAQASSALIAAVASGRLPVGGRTGALVARAILDQGGLGQRVGRQMTTQMQVSPDLRRAIDLVDSIVTPPAPGSGR